MTNLISPEARKIVDQSWLKTPDERANPMSLALAEELVIMTPSEHEDIVRAAFEFGREYAVNERNKSMLQALVGTPDCPLGKEDLV